MKYSRYAWLGSLLLAAVPPVLLANYLLKNAVNVPFWDQWEITLIIQNVLSGNFYFNDFWHQHNEHRIFIPRILMVAVAIFTNWDVRYELAVSVVLATLSFGILFYMVYRMARQQKQQFAFLLPVLISMVWFSLLQAENWMWGWQIQWYSNVLGVVLALYGLHRVLTKGDWLSLALMLTGGLIAQFSLGSGVLVWPLLLVCLFLAKTQRKYLFSTVGVGAAATVLYYLNYHDPVGDPSKALVLEQPLAYLHYIAIYFGRPLSFSPQRLRSFSFSPRTAPITSHPAGRAFLHEERSGR